MKQSALILNGVNLNRLGLREPEIYGHTTLAALEQQCKDFGAQHDVMVESFQTNHEGEMIERIHKACDENWDAIIINPAAWTHSSVAVRDALLNLSIPIYEVHLSNIHKREAFRHHSYVSDIAQSVICGMGIYGYISAIYHIAQQENL